MDALTPEPQRLLPVWEIFTGSFQELWRRRQLLSAPFALLALANFVILLLAQQSILASFPASTPQSSVAHFSLIIALSALTGGLIHMAAAIGLHRWILLNEGGRNLSFFRFDNYLLSYLFTALKYGVCLIPAMALIGIAVLLPLSGASRLWQTSSGAALFMGLIILLTPRLMLAFPAAALGSLHPLTLSWRASRGNWLRLSGVIVLSFSANYALSGIVDFSALIVTTSIVPVSQQWRGVTVISDNVPTYFFLPIAVAKSLSSTLFAMQLVAVASLSFAALSRPFDPD